MNVKGRWIDQLSTWRKISLSAWRAPDNATIHGALDLEVGALRAFLEERSRSSGVKCTVTHAVTRAVAMALRQYPEANVLVRCRNIWVREDVDVFLQVAMPVPGDDGKADLSGTVIRKADTKRVEEIARELRDLAKAVRDKEDGEMAETRGLLQALPGPTVKLALAALSWIQYDLNLSLPKTPRDPFGGAMVTTVGMFGISRAYAPLVTFSRCPIIILVGQIEDRPTVRDGEVVVRKMCTLTGSFDHRILDGFLAGKVSQSLRQLLERPELLDLDPMTALVRIREPADR